MYSSEAPYRQQRGYEPTQAFRWLDVGIEGAMSVSRDLIERIESRHREEEGVNLASLAGNGRHPLSSVNMKCYNTLNARAPVSDVAWAPNSKTLVNVTQDESLLVWEPLHSLLTGASTLPDDRSCVCDVSADGRLAAAGGLSDKCTVLKIGTAAPPAITSGVEKPIILLPQLSVFKGHRAYISAVSFLAESSSQLLTASGDKNSILWDITQGGQVRQFKGHSKDVMSLSVDPTDANMFATCGDKFTLVWDVRSKRTVRRINQVPYPAVIRYSWDGNDLACGLNDGTVNIFDMRSDSVIATLSPDQASSYASAHANVTSTYGEVPEVAMGYQLPDYDPTQPPIFDSVQMARLRQMREKFSDSVNDSGILSLEFSKSHRALMISYSQWNSVFVRDTLTGRVLTTLDGHAAPVSSIKISKDGEGVATASRDGTVKIFSQ